MNKISVVIPVMNQKDSTIETIKSFLSTAQNPKDFNWIIIDNNSDEEVVNWFPQIMQEANFDCGKFFVYRNKENVGVTQSLNQAWKMNAVLEEADRAEYLFYSHNDVVIEEKGWDIKVSDYLDILGDVGVMGFGGARGIGSPDIYKTPYNIWQLARVDFISNMREAMVHGRRMTNTVEKVAVLDGFALIVNTKLLDKVNGFDTDVSPIHHSYDNDMCLESITNGYTNYVINVACHHNGGRTATRSDYTSWLKEQGVEEGDSKIHADTHIKLYEKWRNVLPIRVLE